MPPHIIIIGMPEDIIDIMFLQHSMNISLFMPSIGIISQVMPLSVIVHFMLPIIIGIIIGIMLFIIGMLFIGILPIGMPFIIMGMLPIIGIIPFIIIGFIFIAGFIIKLPDFGLFRNLMSN
jgi:amino acid transporter